MAPSSTAVALVGNRGSDTRPQSGTCRLRAAGNVGAASLAGHLGLLGAPVAVPPPPATGATLGRRSGLRRGGGLRRRCIDRRKRAEGPPSGSRGAGLRRAPNGGEHGRHGLRPEGSGLSIRAGTAGLRAPGGALARALEALEVKAWQQRVELEVQQVLLLLRGLGRFGPRLRPGRGPQLRRPASDFEAPLGPALLGLLPALPRLLLRGLPRTLRAHQGIEAQLLLGRLLAAKQPHEELPAARDLDVARARALPRVGPAVLFALAPAPGGRLPPDLKLQPRNRTAEHEADVVVGEAPVLPLHVALLRALDRRPGTKAQQLLELRRSGLCNRHFLRPPRLWTHENTEDLEAVQRRLRAACAVATYAFATATCSRRHCVGCSAGQPARIDDGTARAVGIRPIKTTGIRCSKHELIVTRRRKAHLLRLRSRGLHTCRAATRDPLC
mmetsp:Transcript_10338/g.29455  ORF Transcript_10338/g.29455 Transcript_10338/m.29455 type:complete len:441 (+) Transcript_10338:305-1627(+)